MIASPAFPARLLMTADAIGGVWQYAIELARGLCRRGTRVMLAVMGPNPSAAQCAAAAAIEGLQLVHRPYCLEWMQGSEDDLVDAALWLAQLQQDFEPDLVHINGYAQAVGDWAAPVVVVCHSCVRTWWQAVRGGEAPAEWNAYSERVADGLAAADLVVAPSASFLAAIQRTYSPQSPARVIHNGRSGPFTARAPKEPLIFSCGRAWDAAKGIEALKNVAPRLPWPVYLAGEMQSPDGDTLTSPVGVRALGSLTEDRLAEWLSRAAIFALPARYEPFGLSVLEAAQSGCALVLGDIETLRELWADAALYVDPADEEALGAAVTRLISDGALCRAMAARALGRARRYSAEAMVTSYLDAYRHAQMRHHVREAAPHDSWRAAAAEVRP